jgi:hypothetical protein
MPKHCKNRDSGGLVGSCQKGAEGKMKLKAKGKSFHTGAGLLALAAERNPQAFWMGDGRPIAVGLAYSHHKALRR